jgi:hypothetical protein
MKNPLGASKQTTFGGLALSLPLLLRQLANLIDGDPATVFDFTMVIAALGGLYALWKARDNMKTSESVGAK